MNRKIVLLVHTSILLLSLVGIGFRFIKPTRAVTTWTVDDDGPADFSTIQEAIDAASPGDTIYVEAGTYYENIVVDKHKYNIGIIGAGSEVTTLCAANSSKHTINVFARDVNIRSFRVTGATEVVPQWPYASGIYLKDAHNCNLSDNYVTDNHNGIFLDSLSNTTVTMNTVSFCDHAGIYVWQSNGCTIANNNLSSNTHYGIILWDYSNSNALANNIALDHNTRNYSAGIALGYSDLNVITNNKVSNNSIGIWIQQPSDNNSIFSNTVSSNTEYGICIGFFDVSKNNKVYHNNITKNTVQAYDTGINIWDNGYPSGGNYWSDHNPLDEDSDKIGDTPYTIDENNTDR